VSMWGLSVTHKVFPFQITSRNHTPPWQLGRPRDGAQDCPAALARTRTGPGQTREVPPDQDHEVPPQAPKVPGQPSLVPVQSPRRAPDQDPARAHPPADLPREPATRATRAAAALVVGKGRSWSRLVTEKLPRRYLANYQIAQIRRRRRRRHKKGSKSHRSLNLLSPKRRRL